MVDADYNWLMLPLNTKRAMERLTIDSKTVDRLNVF